MMRGFIVTGTDTGIGKTVAAAMLALGLDGAYHKPIQSGTEGETDRQAVKRMTGLDDTRVLKDGIMLSRPLSPHLAAELDRVAIDPHDLELPRTQRLLIVEGAGGLLVPVTRDVLQVDVFKRWNLPVILCARTGLGTINHTLLSIEALRTRNLDLAGVLFIGDDNPDNVHIISTYGGAPALGRLPWLENIGPAVLMNAFTTHFGVETFGGRP